MHKAGVPKVVDQCLATLDTCVRNARNLLRIEPLPLAVVEVLVQRHDTFGRGHVDKRVSHIALVLKVDRKVQKVARA